MCSVQYVHSLLEGFGWKNVWPFFYMYHLALAYPCSGADCWLYKLFVLGIFRILWVRLVLWILWVLWCFLGVTKTIIATIIPINTITTRINAQWRKSGFLKIFISDYYYLQYLRVELLTDCENGRPIWRLLWQTGKSISCIYTTINKSAQWISVCQINLRTVVQCVRVAKATRPSTNGLADISTKPKQQPT